MKYPSCKGMKQYHWDAIVEFGFVNGGLRWSESRLCWSVTDKNRIVHSGKKPHQAVEAMIQINKKNEAPG